VGARLSFARMGAYYFNLRPWSGWGDIGYKDHIHDLAITRFSDPIAQEYTVAAGFHNEFTTNAVRSGIWGLLSTALLFFVPLALFFKNYNKHNNTQLALIGITYMICELVSAMSTEVWNLKFTAALSSLLIASLSGIILASYNHNNEHHPSKL
jgi:O-antigen ligase